ncbi:hypothetical protein ACIBCO_35920 [Streptomyces violascens]|uniref:hypothetical protein n=1 Tax=Streptomyces violascens TaxID=67381 RepID=UPI0037A102AB
MALDAVLGQVSTEQGWGDGLKGGSILDQWTTLCPQYEGRIDAVAYDPESRRLDLRPGSDAYAAQLRILGGQLAKQINDKCGQVIVHRIKILPTGPLGTTPGVAPEQDESPATTPEPVRPEPPAGYRRAVALVRQYKPDRSQFANPYLKAAIEASDRALSDPRNREPEHLHADAVAEAERLAEARPVDALDASVRAARAVARRQCQGLLPRPVFSAADPVRHQDL